VSQQERRRGARRDIVQLVLGAEGQVVCAEGERSRLSVAKLQKGGNVPGGAVGVEVVDVAGAYLVHLEVQVACGFAGPNVERPPRIGQGACVLQVLEAAGPRAGGRATLGTASGLNAALGAMLRDRACSAGGGSNVCVGDAMPYRGGGRDSLTRPRVAAVVVG